MKIIFAAAAAMLALGCKSGANEAVKLETDTDRSSYSIGYDIGSNFKTGEVDINVEALVAGIKDALGGGQAQLSETERSAAMEAFQAAMMNKVESGRKEEGEKNVLEGETYLAANKGKEGVVTTASGMQYRVLKKGAGPKPGLTSTVVTHYTGRLINGKVFDSSVERHEPATFPVNQVIAGWTEALQLMEVGSKWELTIPANLAYGARGAGPDIGPNATLIFEVELLEIK